MKNKSYEASKPDMKADKAGMKGGDKWISGVKKRIGMNYGGMVPGKKGKKGC